MTCKTTSENLNLESPEKSQDQALQGSDKQSENLEASSPYLHQDEKDLKKVPESKQFVREMQNS